MRHVGIMRKLLEDPAVSIVAVKKRGYILCML